MNIKPFQQGQLDALCGLYAVINTVMALYGLRDEPATHLFKETLEHLAKVGVSNDLRLVEGMTYIEISKALQHATQTYPITWKRPYHRKKNTGIDQYWEHMQKHCESPNSVIISYIITEGFCDHWTVVSRVTDKALYLLDSDGSKRIYRRNCTVDWHTLKARVLIHIHACFFVKRKVGDNHE